MIHASESQHWYTRDGTPAYTVKSRDGSERPATLRDARKLGLVPSVTSIISCCAKPGLERWKLDQMMHAALTLPRLDKEPEEKWIERVWADSRETAKKAAERGTAVHAAIQGAYEGKAFTGSLFFHVDGAMKAVETLKPITGSWTAERSFSCDMGFGGKVDLSCGNAVLDFKTKEFGEDADLKTWDEHSMQLAAYRYGLGMPEARCAIVYVSVTNPGLAKLLEIPEAELQRGWEMFVYLLGYWKAKNKFHSGWEVKVAA
jgi:hypothetical protein